MALFIALIACKCCFLCFSASLIICQSNKGDFIVIFQDLCSQRMDLKCWLLCGCQSLETRGLDCVCKQSLIAKKEFAGAHVFFWHFGLLKDRSNEKTVLKPNGHYK